MRFLRWMMVAGLVMTAAACSWNKEPSKFKTYDGPEVTRIEVFKEQRMMYLMHNDKVLKRYDIGLGFQPVGHKQFSGDGKTPEGIYLIDRRNPNSQFHLSIGVSYPNPFDRQFAESQGKSPGGDIFIHGRPPAYSRGGRDWTAGCIAVTDEEMEQIYAMVHDGTIIQINP